MEGTFPLLGAGLSSCTNELPAVGDRWCALSHEGAAGLTELWVVNVSAALAEPPVPCDGTNAACVRLTENLWTGDQLWGPSHPYTHRFDGSTLLFHADAGADVREPYEGPIYAWRPGWAGARQLTTERGVTCVGHRRNAAVFCIDALDSQPSESGFGPPYWDSFDLRAGRLDAAPDAPLRVVERISIQSNDARAAHAELTRGGDKLAYSYPNPGTGPNALRWVSLDAEVFEPLQVLDDADGWVLANDGAAVYFLSSLDPTTALGQLAVADFPSGGNVQLIATDVEHIDPVGAFDDLSSDEDRGIGYDRWTAEGPSFEFLADRSNPTKIVSVGVNVEAPRVSASGEHSLFYQAAGSDWPTATVARNDGGGSCALNNARSAETYGGAFTANSQRALWIEYGNSGSEEGWIADPATCGEKTKFGDWVLGFALIGDFVYFKGGDEADSTDYLQYARIPTGATTGSVTPLVVVEQARYPFLGLHVADTTYLIFPGAVESEPGLYVHGPLEQGFPAE